MLAAGGVALRAACSRPLTAKQPPLPFAAPCRTALMPRPVPMLATALYTPQSAIHTLHSMPYTLYYAITYTTLQTTHYIPHYIVDALTRIGFNTFDCLTVFQTPGVISLRLIWNLTT